ncbi:MAG: glycosyltransferase family 2 protein [Sulfolobales archaeon]|nr:glycosyltransferase family 2 protein [Sulfolobales archaeon]
MLDLVSSAFGLVTVFIVSANSLLMMLAYLSKSHPVKTPSEDCGRYPSVTVVVPAYREGPYIHYVLQSLKEVRYPRDKLRLIIVGESGDSDTYGEVLKICEVRGQHLNCGGVEGSYLENSSGVRSKPAALNYALRYVDSEILAVYDAEDTIHPDHVLAAVELLGSSDVAAIQFVREVASVSSKLSGAQVADFHFYYRILQPYIARKTGLAEICGSAFFIKTRYLVSVGGFNSTSPTEDLDLTYRIGARGWRVLIALPPSTTRPIARASSLVRQRARWIRGGLLSIPAGLKALPRSLPLLLVTGFMPLTAATSTVAVAAGFVGLLSGFDMTLFRQVFLALVTACSLSFLLVILAAPKEKAVLKYLVVMSAIYYLASWRAVVELLTAPRAWTKSDSKA